MRGDCINKKIPKVFQNEVNSDGNNEKVSYTNKNKSEGTNINKKIEEIFNSKSYVYKADVDIKLNSGWTNKRIVGRNSSNLITMENELIPIVNILDIKMR
ncbi:MAG: hypothetical protein IKE75_01505 [Bacilli bacterium]|nr:hypothetical protein [Bacilli bacterium]